MIFIISVVNFLFLLALIASLKGFLGTLTEEYSTKTGVIFSIARISFPIVIVLAQIASWTLVILGYQITAFWISLFPFINIMLFGFLMFFALLFQDAEM